MSDRPLSPAEQLTAHFYAWERRGRGWGVSPYPVVLEPPFHPFFHLHATTTEREDDARIPGAVELLWRRLRRSRKATPCDDRCDIGEELPFPDESDGDAIAELQLKIPSDGTYSSALAERMLVSLGTCADTVAFELIGFPGQIVMQYAVREDDAPIARRTLNTFAHDVAIEETRDYLATAWRAARGEKGGIVDFGLSREFMLPLAVPSAAAVDPLLAFIPAFQDMAEGERGILQILFQRAAYPWAESALRAVTDGAGGAFFIDAPEMVRLTAEKIASPLFACVVRLAARAAETGRVREIIRALGTGFAQFGRPTTNELIPLSNDDYPTELHEEDLVGRRTRRSGMLLSTEELAALARLPGPAIRVPSLRGTARTTKAAVPALHAGDIIFGENAHRGETVTVWQPEPLRHRHTYVIGATGTGKSTFLASLMRQDIEAGRGLALLDPHGDLVEEVLSAIPAVREDDVILFDPSDEAYPIGFNVLGARSERERDLLASDLADVFRRFATSWGDQMTAVLGNAVLAFLENPDGGTLLDLRRFLADRAFRAQFLAGVEDPQVQFFWEKEFPLLSGRPQLPILTRLDAFLRPRAIRHIVAQKECLLDLGAVMDEGKILLVKLAQGAIGEVNAHLLGSLLIAKFQQMAQSREGRPASERRDFFLYLDEFHHFATRSLGAMLSGARKYRVGLVLAHQELRQFGATDLQSAVLTNAATRVCFRLGDDDARKLADGFGSFDAADLQSLGVGEAVCRVERADWDFNLAVPWSSPPGDAGTAQRSAIVRTSRARYGRPAREVEAAVAKVFEELKRSAVEKRPAREAAPRPEVRDEPPAKEAARAEREPHTGMDTVPVAAPPERPKNAPRLPAPPQPGRGGTQHKYLQTLLKRFGEERGFRATIEAPVPSGGQVDVLLERDDTTVAVEISITSTDDQELANLRKCLDASFEWIVLVSPHRRTLRRIERLAADAFGEARTRVAFHTPEEFLVALEQLHADGPRQTESTVLGYRVRTSVAPLDPNEHPARVRAVAETILQSMRRLKT